MRWGRQVSSVNAGHSNFLLFPFIKFLNFGAKGIFRKFKLQSKCSNNHYQVTSTAECSNSSDKKKKLIKPHKELTRSCRMNGINNHVNILNFHIENLKHFEYLVEIF